VVYQYKVSFDNPLNFDWYKYEIHLISNDDKYHNHMESIDRKEKKEKKESVQIHSNVDGNEVGSNEKEKDEEDKDQQMEKKIHR